MMWVETHISLKSVFYFSVMLTSFKYYTATYLNAFSGQVKNQSMVVQFTNAGNTRSHSLNSFEAGEHAKAT
jgi:hypothetical protein